MNEWLVRLAVGAVTFVFVGNFLASALIDSYTPDPTIGPIMGTIAAAALGYTAARRNGNGKHK